MNDGKSRIVMGSDSTHEIMAQAADFLDKMGIDMKTLNHFCTP